MMKAMAANRMSFLARTALMSVCAGAVVLGYAEPVGAGFKMTEGIHAVKGESKTLDGGLVSSPDGLLVKTGEGTLEVPMSAIDASAPYSLAVSGGCLKFSGAAGNSVVAVPDVVTEKAAFWVDSSGLQVGDTVAEWADRRAGATWSAKAQFSDNAVDDVPPVVVETNGMKGVYFGGQSGKWMRFKENGADASITNVHHFFVVHGVIGFWSPVLSNCSESRGAGMLTGNTYIGGVWSYGFHRSMFFRRGDLDCRHYAARFFLDGLWIDPYVESAREGCQLLEGDLLTAPASYNTFYKKFFEEYDPVKGEKPGGDVLCEAILFTCRLTEKERLAVERYLMNKWNLPQNTVESSSNIMGVAKKPRSTGTVLTAPGATAEISVPADGESVPLCFKGTGSVVKKGAGTLVVGPGDGVSGEVDFTLQEGDILLRGGSMPPVAVAAGETWSAEPYPTTARPKTVDERYEYDTSSGVKVSRAADAGEGSVKKLGEGTVAVNGIAKDVKRLIVSEGTLRLAAKENSARQPIASTAELEVAIPNHSFETPFIASDKSNRLYNWSSKTCNEWTKSKSSSISVQYVTLLPKISTWTEYDFPDGTNALLLLGGPASTKITVPRAGEYELSFWATSRYGSPIGSDYNKNMHIQFAIDVKFAERLVGRCYVNKGEFMKYRCRFMVSDAEAGKESDLTLASDDFCSGSCVVLDDLHIIAVPLSSRTDTVKVPGGDFEFNSYTVPGCETWTEGLPAVFLRNMCVDGWNFSLADGAVSDNPTNGYVAVVSPSSLTYNNSGVSRTPMHPFSEGGLGSSALGFIGDYGIAESGEFTLPKGKWILRGRKAARPMQAKMFGTDGTKDTAFTATAFLGAEIIRGDVTADLGLSCTPENSSRPFVQIMQSCFWTNVIDVAADETVKLRFRCTGNGSMIVDDLEFVSVSSSMSEMDLIANPGFECEGACWEGYIPDGKIEYAKQKAQKDFSYSVDTWANGFAMLGGDYCGSLQNRSALYTSVDFPSPGLYRLTFHSRPRSDGQTGPMPLVARVLLADGSTNVICRVEPVLTSAFVEHSYLFRMSAGGTHRLELFAPGVPSGILNENVKDKANNLMFVDDVHIVKVDEAELSSPSIPEKLRVKVLDGAKLALDYPGTNIVSALRLGAEVVSGDSVVDAVTHPEYISGIGALCVKSPGTVLIVR